MQSMATERGSKQNNKTSSKVGFEVQFVRCDYEFWDIIKLKISTNVINRVAAVIIQESYKPSRTVIPFCSTNVVIIINSLWKIWKYSTELFSVLLLHLTPVPVVSKKSKPSSMQLIFPNHLILQSSPDDHSRGAMFGLPGPPGPPGPPGDKGEPGVPSSRLWGLGTEDYSNMAGKVTDYIKCRWWGY